MKEFELLNKLRELNTKLIITVNKDFSINKPKKLEEIKEGDLNFIGFGLYSKDNTIKEAFWIKVNDEYILKEDFRELPNFYLHHEFSFIFNKKFLKEVLE
jgi:hypothetical protein